MPPTRGAFFDFHIRGGLGLGNTDGYPPGLMAGYRRLLDDPSTVQAICEDYRAGATIDRQHDDDDLGSRRIECPVLALWSAGGALARFYGDVVAVWQPWAADVTGHAMQASHFLVEDQPEQTADHLTAFLGSVPAPERGRRRAEGIDHATHL